MRPGSGWFPSRTRHQLDDVERVEIRAASKSGDFLTVGVDDPVGRIDGAVPDVATPMTERRQDIDAGDAASLAT